jgi:hypothetical protein
MMDKRSVRPHAPRQGVSRREGLALRRKARKEEVSMGGRRCFAAAGLLIGISIALGPALPARADEWRRIDPADLALKDNPASPGSQAMILYREEYTDSTGSYVTEYYRIKIFTAAGKKYGDIEIPFDQKVSSIHDIKARTILPNGSAVEFKGKPFEKVVVKGGGVKVAEETFSLPDVQPGCIIEYKYRQQYDSDYYWNIIWSIQRELFIRDALFSIRPPTGDNAPGLYWRTMGFAKALRPEKQKDGTFSVEVHNIPGLNSEPYMMPMDMVRGRVEFFFLRDDLKNATKFWNERAKSMSHKADSFTDKKSALEKVVAETISPNDAPMDKLRKLYARAQQIRNAGFYPIGPVPTKTEKLKQNNNVEDILKHGYGYGNEINALFLGLARAAGFDASEVYAADRRSGMFHPEAEDDRELNANIVLVRVGGQDLFFDPASPDYPFGLVPWDETGIEGLAVSRQGAQMVKIPSTTAAEAVTERHANLTLDAKGALSGTLEVDFTGIRGSGIRQAERGEGDADRRKNVSKIIQGWLPSSANFQISSITGWKHSSAPLRVEGTLSIPGYATSLGKRMLVPLTPFASPEANAFNSATRVNDVYFEYPNEHRDDITLHLPAGYGVESLPKPPEIHQPAFVYGLSVTKGSDTLHVTRDLQLLGFYFPVKYYPAIRSVFSMVKTGDDDQAVLENSVAAAKR